MKNFLLFSCGIMVGYFVTKNIVFELNSLLINAHRVNI